MSGDDIVAVEMPAPARLERVAILLDIDAVLADAANRVGLSAQMVRRRTPPALERA